jgi:hypothetical protein
MVFYKGESSLVCYPFPLIPENEALAPVCRASIYPE